MKNAIKYILSRTNIKQKDLAEQTGFDKRYVSKVVNRAFAVPPTIIKLIVELTGVPKRLIVDDKDVCRELNSIDLHELDGYLDAKFFLENAEEVVSKKEKIRLKDFPECEKAIREYEIKSKIAKLQRDIRKDILSVDENVDYYSSVIDIQNNNIYFYEKLLETRNTKPINKDEWDGVFEAFDCLIDDIPEETVKKETDPLVYGIYVVIKKSREIKATKDKKRFEELKEIFTSILDDFEKE